MKKVAISALLYQFWSFVCKLSIMNPKVLEACAAS